MASGVVAYRKKNRNRKATSIRCSSEESRMEMKKIGIHYANYISSATSLSAIEKKLENLFSFDRSRTILNYYPNAISSYTSNQMPNLQTTKSSITVICVRFFSLSRLLLLCLTVSTSLVNISCFTFTIFWMSLQRVVCCAGQELLGGMHSTLTSLFPVSRHCSLLSTHYLWYVTHISAFYGTPTMSINSAESSKNNFYLETSACSVKDDEGRKYEEISRVSMELLNAAHFRIYTAYNERVYYRQWWKRRTYDKTAYQVKRPMISIKFQIIASRLPSLDFVTNYWRWLLWVVDSSERSYRKSNPQLPCFLVAQQTKISLNFTKKHQRTQHTWGAGRWGLNRHVNSNQLSDRRRFKGLFIKTFSLSQAQHWKRGSQLSGDDDVAFFLLLLLLLLPAAALLTFFFFSLTRSLLLVMFVRLGDVTSAQA